MRETRFIRQNKEKWQEFERQLDQPSADPDRLRELFVQITDDLSYSRTFYPNRSVRVYLNGLAQRIFPRLEGGQAAAWSRIVNFWTSELPLIVHDSRQAFRLALFVFLLSFTIGLVSSAYDPDFAEVILGSDYVEMTRANIESGDPMAVYKARGAFDMFFGITVNNLYVAFLTFALGIVFGIGSLVLLISNGIMVGAFQYFFIQHGLFQESFLTIWIHGTLEISAIVIAAAAGITLGRGLAFPGSYTRLQAFQRSARRGLKIMIGTAPLFITAAFLEGYLTRHTEAPDALRALFIGVCLLWVLFYFAWYPAFAALQGRAGHRPPRPLAAGRTERIDLQQVKGAGQLFADALLVLRRHLNSVAVLVFGGALAYCLLAFGLSPLPPTDMLPFSVDGFFQGLLNWRLLHAGLPGQWWPTLAGGVVIFGLAYGSLRLLDRETGTATTESFQSAGPRILPAVLLVGFCAGAPAALGVLLTLLVLPFALLLTGISWRERKHFFDAVVRAWALAGPHYPRLLSLAALLYLVGWFFLGITNTLLIQIFFEAANWVIHADQASLDQWTVRLLTFIFSSAVNLIWILLYISFGLLYHSQVEIKEAPALRQRLSELDAERQLRGIAREEE